jgi:glutamine---fructose-6-phosphate transaminase (isomerizing)
MEEMIQAEADLPRRIADRSDAQRLGELLRAAVETGAPILLAGCGTSEHAARAGQVVLEDRFPRAAVTARDAFEAHLEPPTHGLVVAISHDGGTLSTIATARQASERGAQAVLLTARPEVSPEGVEPIATPIHDGSWCHTIAYLSPLLSIAQGTGAIAVEEAERLIEEGLGAREQRRRNAEDLAGCSRILIIGSGVDELSAAELALKIDEATHIPATPLGAEKVLHGHLPAADRATGGVLLRFDPSHAADRDRRADTVRAACATLEMPFVALEPERALDTRTQSLIGAALALQLLTLELSTVLGVNPDLIRTEDPVYKRVTEVAAVCN